MSVFCIGNIDIRDFEKYRNSGYLENAARTITEYGGRYRVRGGQTKIIEGQPVLHRLVVIEFPSMESFESWYSSDAYAPWKKIRQELSETDFFVVEGLTEEESETIANPACISGNPQPFASLPKLGNHQKKNLTSQSSPLFRGENHCREIIAEWIEKDLQDAMKIMPPHTPNRKQQSHSDTEISLSLVSFPKPN